MKSLLTVLVLALSAGIASAHPHEHGRGEGGGTRLTGPDDYYNYDYACHIAEGVDLFINAKPHVKVGLDYYDPRGYGKVHHRYLTVKYDHQAGASDFYQITYDGDCPHAAYLEMGDWVRIWDMHGNVISECAP